MFVRRATSVVLVSALAVACGSSATDENPTTEESALVTPIPISFSNLCYAGDTASLWLSEAGANTTLDTSLVWYKPGLTAPAGSGPIAGMPYVGFVGLPPGFAASLQTSSPEYEPVIVWVPEDEAGNFTLFNSVCNSGGGSGVGTPLPRSCSGDSILLPIECFTDPPPENSTSQRHRHLICNPAPTSGTGVGSCLTYGMIDALPGDNSCPAYVDTFCN